MTKLRWSNAPYEADPALVQRDRQIFWPSTGLFRQKDPRNDLFNRCHEAKWQYDGACAKRDDIELKLRRRLAAVTNADKADQLRMARGLEPEDGTIKARREARIEQEKQQLAQAEAKVVSTRGEYQRLVSLWRETQPTYSTGSNSDP